MQQLRGVLKSTLVVGIICAILGGLVTYFTPIFFNRFVDPLPPFSTITDLMDKEIEAAEHHDLNLVDTIYDGNAVVADAGCQTDTPPAIWYGRTQIEDRYRQVASFTTLHHVNIVVTWNENSGRASKATAAADTIGILNQNVGGTEKQQFIKGHEQWAFARNGDRWQITSFIYNICLAQTSAPTPVVACNQPPRTPGGISLAGLGYSPYHTGQYPGIGASPTSEEVEADILTLASLTGCIRLYSSTGPTPAILQATLKAHLGVVLGISLGRNQEANNKEIAEGEQLASNPVVRAIIVGNEVLLRKDMPEETLRAYIRQVRAYVQQMGRKTGHVVPVSVAEGYGMWLAHPELADDVDFITIHIYPFWQMISIDNAIQFLGQAYKQITDRFPRKQVVIGETGWPSAGPMRGQAVPSHTNQVRYMKEFTGWATMYKVQYFYFEAFDEGWKAKTQEGDFGPYWGLYQEDGKLKDTFRNVLPDPNPATLLQRSYRDVYTGGTSSSFMMGIASPEQQYNWVIEKDGVVILSYPANQQWGVMFFIVQGKPPIGQHHPSIDLSAYRSLVFDMRASGEGPCVRIGIKDRTQPDDGSEVKVQECLSTHWTTFKEPLSVFSVDLTHLYVVFEVAFVGETGMTVELRNVRYSPVL